MRTRVTYDEVLTEICSPLLTSCAVTLYSLPVVSRAPSDCAHPWTGTRRNRPSATVPTATRTCEMRMLLDSEADRPHDRPAFATRSPRQVRHWHAYANANASIQL